MEQKLKFFVVLLSCWNQTNGQYFKSTKSNVISIIHYYFRKCSPLHKEEHKQFLIPQQLSNNDSKKYSLDRYELWNPMQHDVQCQSRVGTSRLCCVKTTNLRGFTYSICSCFSYTMQNSTSCNLFVDFLEDSEDNQLISGNSISTVETIVWQRKDLDTGSLDIIG